MADLPPYSGAADDDSEGRHGPSKGGPGRWVFVIVIVVVVLFVVLHQSGIMGRGLHGGGH